MQKRRAARMAARGRPSRRAAGGRRAPVAGLAAPTAIVDDRPLYCCCCCPWGRSGRCGGSASARVGRDAGDSRGEPPARTRPRRERVGAAAQGARRRPLQRVRPDGRRPVPRPRRRAGLLRALLGGILRERARRQDACGGRVAALTRVCTCDASKSIQAFLEVVLAVIWREACVLCLIVIDLAGRSIKALAEHGAKAHIVAGAHASSRARTPITGAHASYVQGPRPERWALAR